MQLALQVVEPWRGPGPAHGCTAFIRLAAGLLLDGVEGNDPFQCLGGDRRVMDGMHVEELAPDMQTVKARPSQGPRWLVSMIRLPRWMRRSKR